MSAPAKTKKVATSATPKVVVRRSSKRMIVNMAMKRQLRNNAKSSTRSAFPELLEWRRT